MGGTKWKTDFTVLQEMLKTTVVSLASEDFRNKIFYSFYDPPCDDFGELVFTYPSYPPIIASKTKILQLLRSKLMQHKWGDAALLLLIICQLNWKYNYNNTFAEIIWRVGNEVLYHHPQFCKDFSIISMHKQTMCSYTCALDSNHVMLEYVFALLSSQNYVEALNELKYHAVIGKGLTRKEWRISDIDYWSDTMEAYLSMVCYISWKLKLVNAGENVSEESAEDIGMRAIQHFGNVIDKPGCWDIFIAKHTELLQYFGNFSKLESDLSTYTANHPDNINAQKYLYVHLVKFSVIDNRELKVTTLLRLQNLSPADPLIIDLFTFLFEDWCKKQTDDEFSERDAIICAEVLLSMLDHPAWAGSIELWTKLVAFFETVRVGMPKIYLKKIVESVWVYTERNTWWPFYHFTIQSLNYDDLILLRSKYFIGKIFMSKKCNYNKLAKRKLKHVENEIC